MKDAGQRDQASRTAQRSWIGLIVLVVSALVVLAIIIVGFLYFGFVPF